MINQLCQYCVRRVWRAINTRIRQRLYSSNRWRIQMMVSNFQRDSYIYIYIFTPLENEYSACPLLSPADYYVDPSTRVYICGIMNSSQF